VLEPGSPSGDVCIVGLIEMVKVTQDLLQ